MDWREKLQEINKEFTYNFDFEEEEYFEYFFNNVIDLSISREECIEKELPYLSKDGTLRNVDAFRVTALRFKEKGKYTNYPIGSEDYFRFWDDERNKCRNGVSLGQLKIPGKFYFFLNFFSMIIAENDQGDEIRTLPNFWFVHFNFFHLLEYCDKYKHDLSLIKPRSVGLSESAASVGVYDLFVIELDKNNTPRFKSNTFYASDERYLKGDDGIFYKMTKAVEWLNENGEEAMLKELTHTMDNSKMHWVAGHRKNDGSKKQTGGSIKCEILLKPDNARGGRQSRIFWEECNIVGTKVLMYDGEFKNIENIMVGDLVMGIDSKPRTVLKTTRNKGKILSCYTNTKNKGQKKAFMYVTPNHQLLVRKYKKGTNQNYNLTIKAEDYLNLSASEIGSLYGVKASNIDFKEKDVLLDPYFLGVWLGDGESRSTKIVVNEKDFEIKDFLYNYCKENLNHEISVYTPINKVYSKGNQCKYYRITTENRSSLPGDNKVLSALQSYDLINNKHIPKDFKVNSKEVRLQVLAGLIDTDGSLIKCSQKNNYKTEHFCIQQVREVIIDDAKFIADSLGFYTYKYSQEKKDGTYYTLIIKGDLSKIPTKIERKKAKRADDKNLFKFTIEDENIEDDYVGLTLDGDHLYITDDFIITHNCGANPNLGKALGVAGPRVRRGSIKTGYQIIWGTSNADKRGIEAFEKVLMNPKGYTCIAFRNVWKNAMNEGVVQLDQIPLFPFEFMTKSSNSVGYFIPHYDVRKMDKNGNPLRKEGLATIMAERKDILDNPKEDTNLLISLAEYPITMEEALLRSGDSMFSTTALIEHYQNMTLHSEEVHYKRGNLEWEKAGNEIKGVRFEEHKNGNVYIAEEPEKNVIGNSFDNLYIGGIDSIDKGVLNSQVGNKGSSFAIVIKKRMIGLRGNKYVAFYMDRPDLESEAYENAAKLLWYYNCKANLEDTKTTIITEFRHRNWLRFLYPQPRLARIDKVKLKFNVNKYGTPGHEKYITHGLELIKKFVHENPENILLPQLVEQLLNYDYEEKGKYDLIAAMQMCEIADEDMLPTKDTEVTFEKERKKVGFYYDNNGHKRWGPIPNKTNINHGQSPDIIGIERNKVKTL